MPKPIIIYDDNDNELRIPTRNEICPRCEGDGTHDHPAFSNGITASEMAEHGDEFVEDYVAGRYDVPCEECNGRGVIQVPDEERADPTALALWQADQEAAWEDEAMRAAERRMGC